MDKQTAGISEATISGVQAEVKLFGALDRIVDRTTALKEANVRLEAANILRVKGVDPLDAPLMRSARNEVFEQLEPLLFSISKFVEGTPKDAPESLATVQGRVSAVMVALRPELSEAFTPLDAVKKLMDTSELGRTGVSDQQIAVAVRSVLKGPLRLFDEKQKSLRDVPSAALIA